MTAHQTAMWLLSFINNSHHTALIIIMMIIIITTNVYIRDLFNPRHIYEWLDAFSVRNSVQVLSCIVMFLPVNYMYIYMCMYYMNALHEMLSYVSWVVERSERSESSKSPRLTVVRADCELPGHGRRKRIFNFYCELFLLIIHDCDIREPQFPWLRIALDLA